MKPAVLLKTAASLLVAAAVPVMAEPQTCGQILYQDMPLVGAGFSTSPSHHTVGGPVLADDFIPAASGRIECVDWWGTRAASSGWEITLHLGDFGAAPLVIPPLTGGFKIFVNAVGNDANGDGIFWYSARINDPNWVVAQGQHYWFSAANFDDGWNWAIAADPPEVGAEIQSSVQSVGAVPCADGGPHCGPWGVQDEQYAFMLQVPEPGILALLGAALIGLGATRRKAASTCDDQA